MTEELRGILGQMLFQRDEATKSTSVLSGGEAARLLFCKLMLQKPNVLVLDEPTNHLDLESINALNIALQKYQGTVFLVTHDHDLIDEVATRIWHFENDHKITDFKGTYEDYQAAVAVCDAQRGFTAASARRRAASAVRRFAPFPLHVNQPGSPQLFHSVCCCVYRRKLKIMARTFLRSRGTLVLPCTVEPIY